MRNKRLLVCDLDNTLYDWVGYFVPSLNAMVDAAVEVLGCDREKLLDDLRIVHQKHHDSEHPFALLETDTVKKRFPGKPLREIAAELDPAFHAFNSMRKRTLRLNPGVFEGLIDLSKTQITLVAHTESKLYGAYDRLQRLNILDFFTRIYCRERPISVHPNPEKSTAWFERIPIDKVTELAHHQTKPDPDVLLEICATEDVSTGDTAYVGNSVARDVLMAKRAGVYSIWAEYGTHHDPKLYTDLVRVSHWTPEEVAREKKLSAEAKTISPDFVATSSFGEVLTALELR
jgi:FMN phosphatase YigB (HAD superfamily)